MLRALAPLRVSFASDGSRLIFQKNDFGDFLLTALVNGILEQAGPQKTPNLVTNFDGSVGFIELEGNDGYLLKPLETLQKPWMVLDK